MGNKNVPSIRFKGFLDDWEQRKLGKAVTFLNGRAYKQKELLDKGKYRVLRVGNFNTNDFWYYSDLELEDNKYADKGDLLYLWATNFGPEIWKEERVIYHYHIWKLNINDVNLDKNYLYTWLITDKERIKQTTNGTTMVHVTKGGMEERLFQNPTNIDEQIKIGNFFKKLDETITLQERELELLKLTKKGFLQQLFTDNQQKFPNIRFANFHDEWKRRKLGNYAEILTGGTPKTSVHKYWEPKLVPWMSSGEVNKKRLNKTDNMISKEGLNNSSAHWIKKHSVLIALAGQGKTRGTVAINNIELTTNQSIAAIVPTDTFYYEFIYQNLIKRYEELRKISSGDGTRGGLNKQIISDVIIMSPNKMEQVLIGSFLKQLDRSITLQENELENLKNIKSAFLQKMFI
ncbi:restriction endonuclease subunit S [Vagococcus fluvialis]|uniref:restriction endonuclease subunit S n=2 Tax=Vagococcus fluvialis TaxID=2738 RepID=UPI001433454E|nr:restriction endonuclease subunit S [Vagococcus fluvialis]NKC60172.1 restriction endonuclease subunit S [Vagococcus fluvialis]NKD51051.1 restriction endonuclease subunit S [Vagococcus fluvialis]